MIRRPAVLIVGTLLLLTLLAGGIVWWLQPKPQSPSSLFQAGLSAWEQGNRSALLEAADRLAPFPEYQQHFHLLRAAYALTGQMPDAAVRELGKLKPEGELFEPALMIAGEASYNLGRLADAHRLFSTIVQERPGHINAHRWLSAIAYDLGAFDEAMRELEIVSNRDPADFRPFNLKGQIQMDMERYGPAQESFMKALSNRPPEPLRSEIMIKLARVQLKQRDYAGASDTLSRAAPSPIVLKLKGECERGLGNPDLARRNVDEAIRQDPQSEEAYALSGILFLDAGQPGMAVDHLKKALQLDPHDYESRYQLEQALRELGQADAAEEQAALYAKTVEIRLELAKLTEEAVRAPQDPEVRERIADLCDQLGKRNLAVMWRKAAAGCRSQIKPSFPPDP